MDTRSLLESLNANNAVYVVIGATAFPVHGYSRMTLDIDIFIEPTEHNAENVIKALTACGCDVSELTPTECIQNKILLRQYMLETDIHPFVAGVSFEQVLKNSVEDQYQGVKTKFASLDDLIRMKKTANRPCASRMGESLQRIQRRHFTASWNRCAVSLACLFVLVCSTFAAESNYRFEGRSTMRRGALPTNRSASAVSRFKAQWSAVKKAARWVHRQPGWQSTCRRKSGALVLAFMSFKAETSFVRIVSKEEKQLGWLVAIQLSKEPSLRMDSLLAHSPVEGLFAADLVNHYETCWRSSPMRHASQPFLDSMATALSKLEPYREAIHLLLRNDPSAARLKSDALLTNGSDHPAAKMLSAWTAYLSGQFEEALKELSFEVLNPTLAGLQGYTRALCHRQMKKLDACHRELAKSTETYPEFGPHWIALGELYQEVGACKKAARCYEKFLALDCTDYLSDQLKKKITACSSGKKAGSF